MARSSGKGAKAKSKRGGQHHHHQRKFALPNRRKNKKVEVTFNAADRHDYLTGFASRKKERRAFGLAMQKVKDRQAKLEERKEQRQAQKEKIDDIERDKASLRREISGENYNNNEDRDDCSNGDDDLWHEGQHNESELKTFQDMHTTHQFGRLVSVTTTYGIPDDDEDSDISKKDFYSENKHAVLDRIDEAQKRAGHVRSYIDAVKGAMGNKKRGGSARGEGQHGGKKGRHGASSMKGMGNGASLKMAKKTLAKFKMRRRKTSAGGEERVSGALKGNKKKRKR